MGVEFILGRPSSRRENVIMDKIAGAMGGDPLFPVLVIVPPQATYSTECMLLERLSAKGMMGLSVASISRVAQRVQEEVFGAAQKTIGTAGKTMLVKQILDERAGDMETLFRLRSQFFLLPQIAGVVAELKQLDITPEMLRGFPVENQNTGAKFRDIALVMEEMTARSGGLLDTEDRLESVIAHIPQAGFIRDAAVFIHGFDMYNAQTVRFITQVMKTARHTVISFLYADPGAPDGGVYGICGENRTRFFAEAERLGLETTVVTEDRRISPDILHIEKNIYAHPAKRAGAAADVTISRAADMAEEADGAAARIGLLIRENGWRYADIAVVCGNSTEYLRVIRERFSRAGIPCFTGEKRGLGESGLADFVLTALELSAGRIKKDTLLAHMAAGYCDVSREQQNLLQNYAYEHIRDGFAFLKPFSGGEEEARSALMGPLERLREDAKADPVGAVAAYLETLRVREKVEEKAAQMREAGLFEDAAFLEQAHEKMARVLEQAAGVGKGARGAALARMIRAGIAAERLGMIPPAADEVLCGDISGTYLPRVKALFVLGVNEGVVPDYSQASDVFSEEERELLLSGLKGLRHTGKMDKQRLAVVKALGRPSEKLFLSYVDNGEMQRSQLLDRLCAIFTSVPEEKCGDLAPLLPGVAFRLTAMGLRAAADGEAADVTPGVAAAVFGLAEKESGMGARIEKLREGIAARNRAARPDAARAKALYGEFSSSATRIEQFYECPYRHFIRYGVRVKELREHTIDQLDAGRFAHDALDLLAKEIRRGGKAWRDYTEEQMAEAVRVCTQTARGRQQKYSLNRHNETVLDAVGRDVGLAAEMIRRQCVEGELAPEVTEFSFELPEGKLRGVVDRIDMAEVDGRNYFSIVDYKTGARDFDLARMAAGVDLQLAVYVLAVRQLLGEEYAFAGAHYMRVYGALREREQALEGLYRMRGIEGVAADVAGRLFGRGERGYLFSVDAQQKADGEYYARSEERYFPEEKMKTVLAFAQKLVSGAARRIGEGENEILPVYDKRNGLACKHCDYAAVCMFEGETDGARVIGRGERDVLLAGMEGEIDN